MPLADTENLRNEDDSLSASADDEAWYGSGSWAYDPRYTLQEKLIRWQLWVMMRQRKISWRELRDELGGVSATRLGQMLKAMTFSDLVALRLEAAIDSITERRHAARCTCNDPSCAVYTSVYDDNHLVAAKKGEIDEWRRWNETALSESTQTASPEPSSQGTQRSERPTTHG